MRHLLTKVLLGIALSGAASGCSPGSTPAAEPERRLLLDHEAEDWPARMVRNRLVHPRFVPATRPVDWMAWTALDLAGNRGSPERLFLRDQPYAGPTLEMRGAGGQFWVSALAAGGRAPLRVFLWVGLPIGTTLDAVDSADAENLVELHGFDPASGEERVDTLDLKSVTEGPLPSPDGFDWFQLAGTLSGDRLGQLELRVRTGEPLLRIGQPMILGGTSRLALEQQLPRLTASRAPTQLDRRRAAERQRLARRRPPPDERPETRDGALRRRRALREMMRSHAPTSGR